MRIFFLSEQEYYGKAIKNTSDLKTNACVTPAQPVPSYVRDALKKVHPEVSAKSVTHVRKWLLKALVLMCSWPPLRYYGCGLVVPECLEGCRILDLGSGSGRDCFMLSLLVGEQGHVSGIDMTDSQVLSNTSYWFQSYWLITTPQLVVVSS